MDIFVNLLSSLTKLFGGNLGVTIIFIGVVSRIIFYPFLKSSLNQAKLLRELKPKLDAAKKRFASDRTKLAQEQAKIYREAGFNPAASCLAPIIQLVVAILLFNSLTKLINTDVNTNFLWWDLARPDAFPIENFPLKIPGSLVILTAIATFFQSKMMLPTPLPEEKSDSKVEKKEKEDLSEALASSQGQLVYLLPLIILWSGTHFPAGLALFWVVSTIVGIYQQYRISGLGGLQPWLKWIRR
jgi:YidC/Oxa1 family membrane protein insertase